MILLKVVLFMLFISLHHCRYPDKVYCVNTECSEPISKATTLISYNSPDEDMISYRGNSEAVIYMKSAGTHPELWYAAINGKIGFVNSKFLRETKIIVSNPQEIVPMNKKADVQPDKVQHAHEVFEGTTIYTTESTASSLQHDVTTESPVALLQQDSTPVLNTNENVPDPNNIGIGGTPGPASNDNLSDHNMKTDSQEKAPDSDLQSSVPVQVNAENNLIGNIEINQNLPLTENNVQLPVENVNPNINPELPVVPEMLPQPQQLVSSATGNTVNSDQIVDMPEKVDFLQQGLTQPNSMENTEPNVSTSSNVNVENTTPQSYQTTTETTTEQSASTASVAVNTDSTTQQPPQPSTGSYPTPDYNSNNQYAQYPQPPQVPVSSELNNGALNQNYDYNANQQYYQANLGQPQPQYASSTNYPEASTEAASNAEVQSNVGSTGTPEATTAGLDYQAASTGYAYSYSNPDPTTLPPPTLGADTTASSISYQSSPEQSYQPQIQDNTGSAYSYPPTETTYAAPNPESTTQYYNYGSSETNTQQQQAFTTESYASSEITGTPNSQVTTESIQSSSETTTASPETTTLYDNYNYASSETTQESAKPATQAEIQTTTETPGTPVMMDLDDYLKSTQPPVDSNTVSILDTESSPGFFSSIYTSLSDLWSSKAEAPAAESIFKSDSVKDAEETFSYFNYFLSTYNSVMGTKSESNALFATSGNTCFTDEYCDGTSKEQNNRLLTFLVTTASSVLLFILGYYYIDGRRRDGKLIGTINTLQRDLLFSTKECEIFKEELTSTKTKLAGIEDNSFGMDDMVQSLKEEIEEQKTQNERLRKSLDDNEKLLRVSENTAHELQNTLSEVENTLSELLGERANSEEHIADLNSKIQAFEEELMSVSRERDNFQLKFVSSEASLDETRKQKKQLEEVSTLLAEANNTVQLQTHEITALKDLIKELKGGSKANIDVTSLIDHTEIKAKLAKALEEKHTLESKYEIERKERSRLSEELQGTQESLTTTNQQATEAQTRLEVLGKYFQERESELMKELSAKESLYLSKQGESASTVEKIELMQQEVQRYKEKCDALTLELAEQESARRAAVGALEARAHGAWLEARAARREADAARDDAQALRRKMAALTRAEGAASPHAQMSSPLDRLAEGGAVPPPLPLAFLPPPLLPPLPRPPPLGRLPSPHQPRYDRRYSPESRYSPDSRYSPGTRYSPERVRASDRKYSPNDRRKVYSPISRRRVSRERYEEGRGSRARNGPGETETEYNSDSPSRERRRRRYSHSGPSSGSGCSSESDK